MTGGTPILGNLHMMIFPVIQASTLGIFLGIFWNTIRYIQCGAPQWCERWFINPHNYSYLRTINHSEIGVNCTNWTLSNGGPTLYSNYIQLTWFGFDWKDTPRSHGHVLIMFLPTIWGCSPWKSPFSERPIYSQHERGFNDYPLVN